jgi:hypothetical protein
MHLLIDKIHSFTDNTCILYHKHSTSDQLAATPDAQNMTLDNKYQSPNFRTQYSRLTAVVEDTELPTPANHASTVPSNLYQSTTRLN